MKLSVWLISLVSAIFLYVNFEFRNNLKRSNETKERCSQYPSIAAPNTSHDSSFQQKTGPGPSAPEAQKFTPYNVTELVDPFTGDFNYSIPLLDIEGYPLTLSYNAGVQPEDEASNVGLGWNLNIGQITRNMRGLPDDFNGDEVTKSMNIQEQYTVGGSLNASLELFGFDPQFAFGSNTTVKFNNYTGLGLDFGYNLGISATKTEKIQTSDTSTFRASINVGRQFSTSGPPSFTASGGIDAGTRNIFNKSSYGANVGTSINSLEGMKGINFSASMNATRPNGSFSASNMALAQGFDYSFSRPAAIPPSQFPTISTANSARVGISGEISGIAPGASIEGFLQTDNLAYNTEKIPAFGYLYEQNNNGALSRGLLDFNREKDGPYIKQAAILPIPVSTYDVFSVSGHGISGSFRAFRDDIGTVHDPVVLDGSFNVNLGAQVKAGNIAGVGVDVTAGSSGNLVTKWELFNSLGNTFSFQSAKSGDTNDHVYFRNVGEFTLLANENAFNKLGGFNPVRAQLSLQTISNTKLVNQVGNETNSLGESAFRKAYKEPRNVVFSYLTAEEASGYGQLRKLRNYGLNLPTYTELNREDDVVRKKHHISEIRITRNDGVNYYYGIPVYNRRYREVAFNASGSDANAADNLVPYGGTDNSLANGRGDNHYFSSTDMPPYAYAYLLTSITSPEYVDVTDNGPTPDDFGNYTSFNYSRVYENFAWRNPYTSNKAYFATGNFADTTDNTGNYVYGEKEIWYVNSIESKNFIARFFLTDRHDGIAVQGENGGVTQNKTLKCINSIKLYSKSELKKRGDETKPIKTIDFVYDYKLCKGAPGSRSNEGKLTLRELRISYYNSEKEKQSPYRFAYFGEDSVYRANSADRWGNFKNSNFNGLTAQEFPYTQQIPATDTAVSLWNLSSIILPTGGKININYESDDYAYVQDKRAMEMLSIAGFLKTPGSELQQKLYNTIPSFVSANSDNSGQIVENINPYIVFKLKKPLQPGEKDQLYEYIKGVKQLYVNFRIAILNESSSSTKDKYEKVDGFIDLGTLQKDDFGTLYGFHGSSLGAGYTMAYIKIQKFPQYGLLKVHPATWLAWQKAKSMLTEIYRRNAVEMPNELSIDGFTGWLISSLQGGIDNFLKLILGYYDMMYVGERGSMVDLSKSFIRLNSYNYKKFGGGLRVKSILIDDNWGKMQPTVNNALNFTYGQAYEYTIEQNNRTISSGVAAYEPVVAGEENALMEQDEYSVDRIFAPSDVLNTIKPYGESMFQSPVVGYSRVKIANIHRGDKLKRKGPGFSVHEFYTAKDFPTKTKQTLKAREEFYMIPNPLVDIINHTASQGFYVETNNMHGKPKSINLFSETDTALAFKSIRYFYKTNPDVAGELDNKALVAFKGTVEPRLVGIDFDMIADARHIVNLSGALDAQMNVDYFQAGPVPVVIPVPVPWPSFSMHELKTHVITKVVHRSGILDSVQQVNNGTVSTAYNMLYDGITGEVLVTRHSDEFGDHYYSTSIPAYWIDKNMGPAYENIGFYENQIDIVNGHATVSNANKKFSVGDKLILVRGDHGYGWIAAVSSNSITIINESGNPVISGKYDVEVVTSGKRNMTSAKAGEVISKANPITGSKLNFADVIDASAIEFKDRWQTYQGIRINYPDLKCVCSANTFNKNLLASVFDKIGQLEFCRDTTVSVTINGESLNLVVQRTEDGLTIHVQGGQQFDNDCEITLVDTSFKRSNPPYSRKEPATYTDDCWKLKIGSMEIAPHADCNETDQFKLMVTVTDMHNQQTVRWFEGTVSCFNLNNCGWVNDGFASIECNIAEGTPLNPFLSGTRNNWRPSSNYKYVTARKYDNPSINKKGFYKDFVPFWSMNEYGIGTQQTANRSKWTRADSATIIDPFGHTIESRNIIGNYSASLFGYGFTLPVATAQNARQSDIAAENFEDYDFNNRIGISDESRCILPPHWKLSGLQNITKGESHTGRFAWEVKTDTSFVSLRMPELSCNTGATNSFSACDLIRNFSPSKNKYVISTWVKVKQCRLPQLQSGQVVTCFYETVPPGETNAISISVSRIEQNLQGNTLVTLSPVGKMIEGWQLFTGEFEIVNENYKSIEFKAVKSQQSESATLRTRVFLDDIRIHPRNANMEAYVYDPQTLRLVAKLDMENFATIYEYDMEGNLSHLKKETEKGIKTVQEVRTGKPKSNRLNIQ